jgi:preprotein translocase subunit SecE
MEKTNVATSLINYLKDAKIELTKVSWPSRKEITRYSVLVVVSVVAVAIFFGALDVGLTAGLNKLISLVA